MKIRDLNEEKTSNEARKNQLSFFYLKMMIHCFHFIFILEYINFKNSIHEALFDNIFFVPIGYGFNMIPFECLFQSKKISFLFL